jgi:hypothetical protein
MKPRHKTSNPSRLYHIIKTKIQRASFSCSSNSNQHGNSNQFNEHVVEDVIDDSLSEDIVRFVSDNIDIQLLRKAIFSQVNIKLKFYSILMDLINFHLGNVSFIRIEDVVYGLRVIAFYCVHCTLHTSVTAALSDFFQDFLILLQILTLRKQMFHLGKT